MKFEKGQIPWNKGKKTGKPAWNKGRKMPEISGVNHPMFGKHPSKETINKQRETLMKTLSNPEVRKRLSEAIRIGMSSPEIRKKLSESHQGLVAWNKGIPMREESKKKLSEFNKKRLSNPEIRKKIGEFHKGNSYRKGKKHSPEAILKMKESHKGQIPWNKGIPMREESKLKVSLNSWQKGKPAWNRGKSPSEESRNKMRKSQKLAMSKPERKEISKKTIFKLYESGSFPKQTNTKPERQIKEELIKRGYKEGIDFIHQFKFMDKFMCDFCFPNQKVIVEVYGDFWHANPRKYPNVSNLHKHQIKDMNKDKAKEAYITKVDNSSWAYLVLWEMDITKNVVECVDKIEEVLRKTN